MNKKIVTSTLLLVLLLFTGCKEQIVHDVNELEANRILTSLHEAKIDGRKVRQADGTWAISVSSSDSLPAIRHLNESRIIRDTAAGLNTRSGIIGSREDQRFRFERALSREIESTLSSIDGVLESRVHLNIPPVDPLFGRRLNDASGSASVLVVANKSSAVSREEVVALVAGASGISADVISVLISQGASADFTDKAMTGATAGPSAQLRPISELIPQEHRSSSSMNREFMIQAGLSVAVCGFGIFLLIVTSRKRRMSRLKTLD